MSVFLVVKIDVQQHSLAIVHVYFVLYEIRYIQMTGKTIAESTQLTNEQIARVQRLWSIVILRIYSFSKLETTEIFTNFFTLIFISWLLFRLLLHVTLCNSFQWRIMSVSCDLSTPNQGTELLSLRLAVSGSIVDPWVYILLRKETLSYIHKMMGRCQRNYDVNLQSSTSLDMNSI